MSETCPRIGVQVTIPASLVADTGDTERLLRLLAHYGVGLYEADVLHTLDVPALGVVWVVASWPVAVAATGASE